MAAIFTCMALTMIVSCNNAQQPKTNDATTQSEVQEPSSFMAANLPDSLKPKFGKYGCTSTKFNGLTYEYTPRGSFEITNDGHYTYNGFEKVSSGDYTVDEQGNLLFTSGYFDGGRAEKIDRPNKFFLVFLTIPGNRWTCGYTDDK